MQKGSDLRLNLIPIKFSTDTFKGYEFPYIDADHLKGLRKKYRESHVFRRQGDKIQCVPISESAEALGEERTFTLGRDFLFAEHLVQSALIRFFHDKGVKFSQFIYPTSIVIEKENLMKDIVGNEEISTLLPMYPEYEIESRLLIPHKGYVTFGILVNFSVRHLIDCTAAELIGKKVDLDDRYVVVSRDDIQESLVDKKYSNRLAGKIIGIEGSTLKLADYRDQESIDSESCSLESSQKNFVHCLASLFPEDLENITNRRLSQIFKVTGAKNQYERLEKVKEWIAKSQPIPCASGLSFEISKDVYELGYGNEVGQYRRLNNPSYVLRPGGSITVTGNIDKNIDDKGPFDTEDFPKKRVRIAVVCPERYKGNVEVFIRQFKDGVPRRSNKDIPYLQGFIRKYRLLSCDFNFFKIDRGEESPQGYKEASLEALGGKQNYNLAIIVTREDYHQLNGKDNPYFVAKSTFMSQGVPVQALEIETIMDERGRPWILNNIALASYAKLGGVPWVLSSTPGMTHELIFGIGSSKVQTERLTETERFVGITTVFSGDGNYLLYNLTREVKYEDFKAALLSSLKDCMDEIKGRYGWQKGDKVRLIFHQAFKKFKGTEEVEAVKEFVNNIIDFDVEYAFVHISRSHPWKLFDTQSEGVPHWEMENGKFSKSIKGEYVPQRGYYIPLGPRAALLTLTGPYQLKTRLQGCPEPILISVHQGSTFTSHEYLANQIYKLTFMSWRSFFPSSMPVTIDYSDWIAYFMGHLRDVPGWNPDTLSTKLRECRWFL
jgi:hypothetical protein